MKTANAQSDGFDSDEEFFDAQENEDLLMK